jgi:hypothetical protein
VQTMQTREDLSEGLAEQIMSKNPKRFYGLN